MAPAPALSRSDSMHEVRKVAAGRHRLSDHSFTPSCDPKTPHSSCWLPPLAHRRLGDHWI